jgi:hypothetical protein
MYGGSARREAATYTAQHKRNKSRFTDISRVGFEPATSVFENANTFQALDRAASAIGNMQTRRKMSTCLPRPLVWRFWLVSYVVNRK